MKIHVLLVLTLISSCYSDAEESTDFQREDDHSGVLRKDKDILTAIVDEYIDRLFENVHKFAIARGLDPMPLPDVNQRQVFRGHVVLTNGTFNGVSTIQRKNHVKLIYNHKTRVITVQFPIIFRDLFFHYHYDVGVSLLKEQGGFAGIMKNYKVTIDLNFDFKKYKLKMAKPMWLNGIVIVKFDGSPFALIKTIIGSLVSTVLTPLIINPILSGIVSKIGNKVVTAINEAIDRFLHPNSTKVTDCFDNLCEYNF